MPIQESTTIVGDLFIQGKLDLTKANLPIAEVDEDKQLNISSTSTDTTYQGKMTRVFGTDGLILDSTDDVVIHSEIGDVNINGDTIRLNCDRFRLPNSRAMYGTEDPNELGLHNVEEGTLYFKLVND